jgi:hypothetical protein
MDNLSIRKGWQALDLLNQVGVMVRLLPAYYPPEYNPIEMMWSKVKSILHNTEAGESGSLIYAIRDVLNQITQKDATTWHNHSA